MSKQVFTFQIVSASQLDAVENLSNSLKKGGFVKVTTRKETKMNKGKGENRNPLLNHEVFEVTTISGWQVGTDYSTSCQNATERSGSNAEFQGKGSWHIKFNEFFQTNPDGTKFYLQLQKSAKTTTKEVKTYFVDGKEATEEETQLIKAWLPKKTTKQSSSQTEAGITEENTRDYILVSLDNVEEIKQGSFTYHFVNS